MRAFFDESAVSPEDGPFMIMAGFVGRSEDFESASDSWQYVLDAHPQVSSFHHNDRRCASLISPLSEVIRDSNLQGFVITIPHAPFSARDSKITKGLVGSRVYDYAFIIAVKYVLWWAEATFSEGEKVDFIFEKRRELQPCIDQLYTPLSIEGKDIWRRAGSCTPEDNKRMAALQMSDLLAGQSLESIRGKHKSDSFQIMESKRKVFIFNKNPPKHLKYNMLLHNLGKVAYDVGMKKILDWPGDTIDPALYEKEYKALIELNRIAQNVQSSTEEEETATEDDEKFDEGMRNLLRANPQLIKAAMEQEKQQREAERKAERKDQKEK